LAEVNIAKHRAGATGLISMTFAAEFTRFRNYTSVEPM
jgi:replicative DNA helicase